MERVLRRRAAGELLEPSGAECRDTGGLRGDRSDTGMRPGHDRADGEVPGLHRAADLARRRVGRAIENVDLMAAVRMSRHPR